MDFDSTEAIKSAVQAGLRIGYVSRWASSKELKLRGLKVVEVDGIKVARHFSLALRAGPEPQGTMAAFRTFALEHARLLCSSTSKALPSGSSSR